MTSLLVLLLIWGYTLVSAKVLDVCPKSVNCVRKCCDVGLKFEDGECVEGGRGISVPEGTMVVVDKPDCIEMYGLEPDEEKHEVFYNNGTLIYEYGDTIVVTRKFCLEENELNFTFAYVCFNENEEKEVELQKKKYIYYSCGLLISAPCLLATILVYATFKSLRNLYGKCTINHNCCLLFSSISLALVQTENIPRGVPCRIIGYAIQFFFMATFFWLNVMCFDMYWAFSGLRNLTGSIRERERKKLILYSIYAWCTPLLILVITVAMDLSPSIPANSIFKPQVGIEKCFFKEKEAKWIYFYLPMALIIISNIFLFGVTAFRIWSHRRETAVLNRVDSRKHVSNNDKERFSLYLKLFIVMGINWVTELISSVAGGHNYFWYIPDFTNTLQGVFIFLIFVWKKKVRTLVRAKLCTCFGKKTNTARILSSNSTKNTNNNDSTPITQNIKMTPVTQLTQTTVA